MKLPFHDAMAKVLNLLLDLDVAGADVALGAGKHGIRLAALRQKICVLECRHTPGGSLSALTAGLMRTLLHKELTGCWAEIAVRIAALFAAFGDLTQSGKLPPGTTADVAVCTGDLSGAMSAWYARKMGLPVGEIICGCNENNAMWELMNHGQLATGAPAVPTGMPEADVAVPGGLEQLIFECGGVSAVDFYLESLRVGETYIPEDALLEQMRQGIYVGVVSQTRIRDTIRRLWQSQGYLMSPYDAVAYASALDHRAQNGTGRLCVILSENNPQRDATMILDMLDGLSNPFSGKR